MEVKAIGKYVRISPWKARLVADNIRGKMVGEAMSILDYSPKKAAVLIRKILLSAVANAENNFKLEDVDQLLITRIHVDEGPTMKRFRARAMGRVGRIQKRTSHVTIVLEEKN
jgi:large subunit ribosomal protein L22